jgi:immune inhibitor A
VKKKVLVILILVAVLAIAAIPAVAGQPNQARYGFADDPDFVPKEDNLPHPLGVQQSALTQKALDAKLNGKAYGKTHEVARGQFVELERTGEDLIFTVLGEFNDFPHNNIAEPDRAVDNTTYWVADFSQAHYQDMLFSDAPGANSMRNFYIEQSSNRYAVDGGVTDWVTVPDNAVNYDDDLPATVGVWRFLQDSVDGWYNNMLADGMTPAEIDDYLSQYDVWDRYDWDGDGNFNEPDGYIDHFQSIHAGEGEEAGGGVLGGQAIWSHRWYTFYNLIGSAGPSADYLLGGIQIGDSSYWVGDYTIEPENGGVGVFTHEFGHDLGLPDLYNTGGGPENSTGFWTLMSSGSWLDNGGDQIGNMPGHMGGWEKFQLGWLNYEVAFAGQKSAHKLGPAETNTKQAQGVFVVLPQKEVTENIAAPFSGSYFYYSGSGNNLDNSMTRSVTLPAGNPSLTAMVNYEIETDWDYAYVTVNGVEVETSLSTNTNPNGQNFGLVGITGFSGGWVPLTVDLTAYAGQTVDIGFRYWTDGAAVEAGFMVDDIQITGQPLDDAESDFGWTFDGFRTTTGTETALYSNYYLAEFRQYRGYDANLEVGPYNFGFLDNPTLGNWVEHFPYQDGLLISYWDTSQGNNNTASHPGQGLILPIDAHPEAMLRADGGVWRNRIQSYDSTFGLEPTDALTLHWLSQPSEHPSLPATSVFNDLNSYWDPANPTGSVIVPQTGTTITVVGVSAHNSFMQILVAPAK